MTRCILLCFLICCSLSAQETLTVMVCPPTADYKPFYSWPADKVQPVGHEVDLALEIGKRMKRKVIFYKKVNYQNPRIDALHKRHVDMVLSCFTITKERRGHVSFSQAYFTDGIGVLVHQESKIKTPTDLKDKKIIAFPNTSSYAWAQRTISTEDYVTKIEEYGQEIKMLEEKKAHAFILDYSYLAKIAEKNSKLRVLPKIYAPEQWGIAVNKSDQTLLKEINKHLDHLKKEGYLQLLRKKWRIANPPKQSDEQE